MQFTAPFRISLTVALTISTLLVAPAAEPDLDSAGVTSESVHNFVSTFCLDCHSRDQADGGLNLETVPGVEVDAATVTWERVIRRLRARQMPPSGVRRPAEAQYDQILHQLESVLDRRAARNPRPGRTATFRRLTRFEYQNAIRDLLAIEINTEELLPVDPASHGFDNVTVAELSPVLIQRYLAAAEKIAQLAVGRTNTGPVSRTFRVRPDITQEKHRPGLPIGTRGGTLIRYTFPHDGNYEVQIRLARDRNEEVEGLSREHQVEVLLDRKRITLFSVRPPKNRNHSTVDAHLRIRFPVTAGPHQLGVTFLQESSSLLETKRQPYQTRFNRHRHPRSSPAVFQVSITATDTATRPGKTPARDRLFVRTPSTVDHEDDAARHIVRTLARRAWRRPVSQKALAVPLSFYREGRAAGDFDAGIEAAVASILVNPGFLFRIEQDPAGAESGSASRVSEIDLASRLSFFLWSSIPDDQLLDLAVRGELSRPEVLQAQTTRMLSDPRSRSLVTNFASQWLYLRNLDSITPDLRRFPDFDQNLRDAMRTETELLFESVLRENRSVLDLIRTSDTFLNERLAKHYGIPHVYGSRFRRVSLGHNRQRGGLLRHGSILTVTSYATRTSPVLRGNWVLENLLGTPPPPPPPNVPALADQTVAAHLPIRERLARHRSNPSCSGCHSLIDPIGFSLEHYDATGRWRELSADLPVDASGGLPDGSRFTGVAGLENALLQRPELLVGTLTEKLLTYALGRGMTEHDAPAVRTILRAAGKDHWRLTTLIQGIVSSVPFQMRTAE